MTFDQVIAAVTWFLIGVSAGLIIAGKMLDSRIRSKKL